MMNLVDACNLVRKYCLIANRQEVLIDSWVEYEGHWLITYGLPSLEDPSRIFQCVRLVVEKQSGNLYFRPSRSSRPINMSEFPENRDQLVKIGKEEMMELERQMNG